MSKPKRGELSIRERILNSKLFLDGEPFTVAQMKSIMPNTDSGVNSALKLMQDLGVVDNLGWKRYKGQRVKIMVKAKPKTMSISFASVAWVSQPSPTEYSFKWEARDL
jgi:hypothetical protein